MLKPPTGEPCAGEPHARFGGRGESILFPTPIIPPALLVVADLMHLDLTFQTVFVPQPQKSEFQPMSIWNSEWCEPKGSQRIPSSSESNGRSENEAGSKEISGTAGDLGESPKCKFTLFGIEMIEKKVKKSGNTGRVYLPPNWVGKRVRIIRID